MNEFGDRAVSAVVAVSAGEVEPAVEAAAASEVESAGEAESAVVAVEERISKVKFNPKVSVRDVNGFTREEDIKEKKDKVINHQQSIQEWMKAGKKAQIAAQIAARMRINRMHKPLENPLGTSFTRLAAGDTVHTATVCSEKKDVESSSKGKKVVSSVAVWEKHIKKAEKSSKPKQQPTLMKEEKHASRGATECRLTKETKSINGVEKYVGRLRRAREKSLETTQKNI